MPPNIWRQERGQRWMRADHRKTRRHRDSGAVAVEAAMVSMLLITLLFGIIDSSFLFKDWLAVSAAGRAGARMGASQPRVQGFAQDSADQVTNALTGMIPANIQQVWVYRTTSAGALPTTCNASSYCVPFTWNGTKLTTASVTNWDYSSQNACEGDPLRDSLGVFVKYRHISPMGFFFQNTTVSESTVMFLEPYITTPCK
jgi:Flp pilus assembly protein TadG